MWQYDSSDIFSKIEKIRLEWDFCMHMNHIRSSVSYRKIPLVLDDENYLTNKIKTRLFQISRNKNRQLYIE